MLLKKAKQVSREPGDEFGSDDEASDSIYTGQRLFLLPCFGEK